MANAPNALLHALGAYDSDGSDGGGGSGSSSSNDSAEGPMRAEHMADSPRAQAGGSTPGDEENGAGADGDRSPQDSPHIEHEPAADEAAAAYEATRRDLCALLGCDAVPDFAPLDAEAQCAAGLQQKFQQWYQLKGQGANFNEALTRNKTFRNPNIYRWLVDHLQLEEAGSNLPADSGFDPAQLRRDFTPKGLAEDQERRARESATKKTARAADAWAPGAAGGLAQPVQFRSAGFETAQPPGSTGPARPGAAPAAQPGGGPAFADAVQRARLIAQRLSQAKRR
ncbi:SAP30-binding protein [Coemansia javaensis]|uniref:SAP30-binding protein n=1 Tax=Coemansia javaensis TaxID=2761396 RepID=A0A9W8HK13_9FUNG|nr:SAP30-binding protein [Coemansia javaensis]